MKRILLIEDDARIANIYSSRLQAQNFRVEVAPDGQSGYYAVYESKPDAVLLALSPPQMDGVSIVGKLRAQKQFQKLPLFILADSYGSTKGDEALAAGANHLISKGDPEALDELVSVLKETLNPAPRRNGGGLRRAAGSEAAGQERREQKETAAVEDPTREGSRSELSIGRVPFTASIPVLAPSAPMEAAATRELPVTAETPGSLANDLLGIFLEDYGKIVHGVRKNFVALGTAKTEAEKQGAALALHQGIGRLKRACQECEITGLEKLCTGLEPLARTLAENRESSPGTLMQTMAHAIDLLAALDNRTEDIAPLNNLKPSVLVVDDENVSRKAVGLGLQKSGISVTSHERADAALKEAEDRFFDLMFLDVEMPGLNGFALCARVRTMAHHKKTPIIFISALNDLKTRASSRISGGNHFVHKPLNYHELGLTAWTFIFRNRLK